MNLPRIKVRFSITIGDDPATKTTSERDSTAIGYLERAGWTDTYMGFTTPANDGVMDE